MGKRKREKEAKDPAKIELPSRTTRGNRLSALLNQQGDDFEEEGDNEFWNQEFFKDEERDDAYNTESSRSDVFSSDFLDTEEDTDDDAAGGGDDDEGRPRRKKIKPPSYRRRKPPPKKKKKAWAGADGEDGDASTPKPPKPARAAPAAPSGPYEAPSLRHSTRVKVAEARTEREKQEQTRQQRKRTTAPTEVKLLTQEELLAEAAQTEIENTRSLQLLVAMEEETKRKADVARARQLGPVIRYSSKRAEDGGVVTVLASMNSAVPPPELQPRTAPPPPKPQRCLVTAAPARYRDPQSGLPFATPAAFAELRRRLAATSSHHHQHPPQQQQPPMPAGPVLG